MSDRLERLRNQIPLVETFSEGVPPGTHVRALRALLAAWEALEEIDKLGVVVSSATEKARYLRVADLAESFLVQQERSA